jgi:hypothetical protein
VKRRTAIAALSTAALMAWVPTAHSADAIEVLQAGLEPSADGEAWVLSADFLVTLNSALEDAVSRGATLPFAVDFELRRPRWYWRDDRVATATQSHRLSYQPITRQYRLLLNGVPMSFPTLSEAVDAMSRVRGWRVMPRDRVSPGTPYEGWLRLRVETDLLPRSFQLSAITGRDWTPLSEWKRFPVSSETPRSAP